jgi:hypothetical protein
MPRPSKADERPGDWIPIYAPLPKTDRGRLLCGCWSIAGGTAVLTLLELLPTDLSAAVHLARLAGVLLALVGLYLALTSFDEG